MTQGRCFCMITAFLIGIGSGTSGATRLVWTNSPSPGAGYLSWDTAAHTIQEAVDIAEYGDTVLVTNGVYETGGGLAYGSLSNRVALTKAVNVQSVNGPDGTVIMGQGPLGDDAVRCAYVGAEARLSGFTLVGGATRVAGDYILDQSGGGLFLDTDGMVTNCVLSGSIANGHGGGALVNGGDLRNSILQGNNANDEGGGAYLRQGGSIRHCEILLNVATNPILGLGGGFMIEADAGVADSLIHDNVAQWGGGAATYSSGMVQRCRIESNTALADGGGVNMSQGGIILDSTIRSNQAYGLAGGVELYDGGLVQRCTVEANAGNWGGGAWLFGSGVIRNSTIHHNSSVQEGGGVLLYVGGEVRNCAVYDNESGRDGGGVYIQGSGGVVSSCTLTRNAAMTGCGGVLVSDDSGLIENSIIWGNAGVFGAQISGTAETNRYNCIQDWVSGGIGNIGDDPLFMAAGSGTGTNGVSGDYHLQETSPCINAGTNQVGMVGATDLGGNPRLVGGRVDMGAYEYRAPVVHYVNMVGTAPVPPYLDWTTAARTIQDAVNAASDGDVVLVADGVYQDFTHVVVAGGEHNIVAVTNRVTVRSVNGPAVTTIRSGSFDGYTGTRGVYLADGARLEGFSLRNDDWNNMVGLGGGVYCESTNAVVTHCVISGNVAAQGSGTYGGALFNCLISGNGLVLWGMGITSSEDGNGSANGLLYNCIVADNVGLGRGGGVYECALYNCLVFGNAAGWQTDPELGGEGGGSYGGTLYNCTIAGNGSAGYGGCYSGTLYNCVVYNNDGTNVDASSKLTYSCTTPLPVGGIGNITNAPMFVNYVATNGDYSASDLHLLPASPCLSSGDTGMVFTAVDLDGNPRTRHGTVAMGAYEWSSPTVGLVLTHLILHGWERIAWDWPNSGPLAVSLYVSNSMTHAICPVGDSSNATGSMMWDTTTVSNGDYVLHAAFYDASTQLVAEVAQSIQVNNMALTWHAGVLATNETWAAGTVHVVEQTVTISGGKELLIAPGAIVKFAKGAGLVVQSGGALNILGAVGAPTVLTSLNDDVVAGDSNADGGHSAPAFGDWTLVLATSAILNLNAYAELRYTSGASSTNWPKLIDPARLWHGDQQLRWAMSGLDAEGWTAEARVSQGGDVFFDQVVAATNTVITIDTTGVPDGRCEVNVMFRDGASRIVGQASLPVITANSSLIWHAAIVTTDETWRAGAVHLVERSISVSNGVSVTIEPGAIVKFAKGAGIAIQEGGILNALGIDGAQIIMTSLADDTAGGDSNCDGNKSVPKPGDWAGVTVQGTGQFNAAYVDTRYGVTFHSGTLGADETWLGSFLHIVNSTIVPSGRTLHIAPGAVVKFPPACELVVAAGGALVATGTAALPITLTSSKDDTVGGDSGGDGNDTQPAPGDWAGVRVYGGQAHFDHTSVAYAGYTPDGQWSTVAGAIAVQGAGMVTLSNSIIDSALFDGLLLWGSGNAVLANSLIVNCDRGIDPDGSSSVDLVNCVLDNNRVGIWGHNGTVRMANTIISDSLEAGIFNILDSPFTIHHSDVWSATGQNYSGHITDQTGTNGNLSMDPKFKDAARGDYRLDYRSPCIDAADGAEAPAADRSGAPRYSDPRTLVKTGVTDSNGIYADMGAFEFVETADSEVDLIGDGVSGPASVVVGDSAAVQWTVINVGIGNAVGPWHDTVYLASAGGLSAPLLVGEVLVGQGVVLGPGQSYAASATVRVPGGTTGHYRWQVHVNNRADIFEGVYWTNNTAAADATTTLTVPALSIGGMPVTNRLSMPNQSLWYAFSPQTASDVLLTLNQEDAIGDVELYTGQGYMPTPQHYDTHQVGGASSSLSVLAVGASTQPYYVLVYARSLPNGPVHFTIRASCPGFGLSSVSPNVVGNSGSASLLIRGALLSEDMTYQVVDPWGGTHNAMRVSLLSSGEAYATFDFTGLPIGAYTVQVAGQSDSLPGALNVISAGEGRIKLNIICPQAARRGRVMPFTIEYDNTGASDASAPVVFVSARRAACQFRQRGQDAWVKDTYQFLAINQDGPAGTLPPGYHGQIQLEAQQYGGETSEALDIGASLANLLAPVDWTGLKRPLQPAFQTDDSWDVIYTTFLAKAGTTYGQLQHLLAADATRLSQLGERVSDVRQLLAFEFQQADGFGMITRRYYLGAFGRGVPDPADVSATEDSNGNVIIRSSDRIRFFTLQNAGSYVGEPGDHALLAKVGGAFQLREKTGLLTVFRSAPDGRLDYRQDSNGRRMTASHSGSRMTGWVDSFGDTIAYVYNSSGRITQMTDAVGRTTIYTYDASGEHLLQVSNVCGAVGLNWVTGQGGAKEHALSTMTYPDGTHTYYEYDKQGRLTHQMSDGGAALMSYVYDTFGGVTVIDAAGVRVTTSPNASSQMAEMLDGLGVTTRISFDANHNPVRIQDSNRLLTTLAYDKQGNPTGVTDPAGGHITLSYEPVYNRVTAVSDAVGHRVVMQYDAKGNCVAMVFADGTRHQYAYDAAGNITARSNRRGRWFHYTYDDHNLLTSKTLPNGSVQFYAYDAHRNLTSIESAIGALTFAYDPADRMNRVTYPDGRCLVFNYDNAGRRTRMADQDGFMAGYGYDSLSRLAMITDGGSHTNVVYHYDAVGRVTRKDLRNGGTASYTYSDSGLLQSLVNRAADQTVVSRFDYTHDTLGRVTSMTTLAGAFTYTYDMNHQLTSVTLPGGRNIVYQYDGAGNRTAVIDNGTNAAYVVNALNEYLNAGTARFHYDADGNLDSKTAAGGVTTYTYDDENRLIAQVSPLGSWTYEYNALGQRTAVTHGGLRREYLCDPGGISDVVGEYQDGVAVAHYVYGLGLANREDAGGAGVFYHFDGNGNTAALVDSSGVILNSYSYLPFGEKLSAVESMENPFTYVGQCGVMDGGEGLYFMRNRWYAPACGRFIQTDPIGLAGGSVNLYQYVGNSPIQKVDPMGLSAVDDLYALYNTFSIFGGVGKTAYSTAKAAGKQGSWSEAVHDGAMTMAGGLSILPGLNVLGLPTTAADVYTRGYGDEYARLYDPFGEVSDDTPRRLTTPGGITGYFGGGSKRQPPRLFQIALLPDSPPSGNARGYVSLPIAEGDSWWARSALVASTDPNDKTGSGVGAKGFIGANGNLLYTVDFENVPTASAAAQQVTVTDPLDANLDWSTLELQTIAFNNVTIHVPRGLQNFSTEAAVSTDPNPVQVNAALDPDTGVLMWTMTSINPVTGQLVEDPLAGFLPPDTTNNIGKGYVTYSVRPKAGLPSGTLITNQARIVFDVNAPILTPTVTNTIDALAPQSSMPALPGTSARKFDVSWIASDDLSGCGVAGYDVYVSRDGGPWTLWRSNDTNTWAEFTGEPGVHYAFYCLAWDWVGNLEATHSGPVAETVTAFHLTQAVVGTNAPNTLVLTWESATNKYYDVWRSTNLSEGFTLPAITNLPATPPLNVFSNPLPPFGPLFLKVFGKP